VDSLHFLVLHFHRERRHAFLLTDGTVMMQEFSSLSIGIASPTWATRRWWKLTPDPVRQLCQRHVEQPGRFPCCQDVLRLGRSGGRQGGGVRWRYFRWHPAAFSMIGPTRGENLRPRDEYWTVFDPPKKGSTTDPWAEIGDAPCAVLPDGSLLLGSIDDAHMAKLDPGTLTWTSMNPAPGWQPKR